MPKIGAPPPSELRIFKWGLNQTTKGPLTFDEESARSVMAKFAARGNAQSFDLWHSQFDETLPPDQKFTVGNYALTVKGSMSSGEGGLFVTRCQFVRKYADEISEGKWPYLSPVPLHTKEGKIVDVKGCALVGRPATCGAVPLLLSEFLGAPKMSKGRLMRDAYGAMQTYSQRLQMLASDGDNDQEKQLANECMALNAQCMQRMADYMTSSNMLGDVQAQLADAEKRAAAESRCIKLLSDEMGETDLDKLPGKVIALKIRSDIGGDQGKADAAAASKKAEAAAELAATLLCDKNAHRATVDRRRAGWIKQVKAGEMTLETLQATLSDLPEVTAPPAIAETHQTPPPPAPTSAAAKEVGNQAAAAQAAATARAAEQPLTLAQLSDSERVGLDFMHRQQRAVLGDSYKPADVEAQYLANLPDLRKRDPLMNS